MIGVPTAPKLRATVTDQCQRRRCHRREAETDHEGTGKGRRRSKSRGSFHQRYEKKSRDNRLYPAIRAYSEKGALYRLNCAAVASVFMSSWRRTQ